MKNDVCSLAVFSSNGLTGLGNSDARGISRCSVNSRVTGMVMKPCHMMPHDAGRTRKAFRAAVYRGAYPSAGRLDQDVQRRENLRTLTGRARAHGVMESKFFGLRNRGVGGDRLIVGRLRGCHEARKVPAKGQEATDVSGKSEAKLLRI